MRKIPLVVLAAFLGCGTSYAADNPQQSKMKTCQAQAGDQKLEGKARQEYVNNCLKAKPEAAKAEKPKSKMAMCNEQTKGLTAAEASKKRSECMKAT